MSQYLDDLKEKLLQPISEAQPCGEDPKYEDAYDQLKQEIAKMGGMGVGSTDWEKVEQLAIGLLETRSKELNLCAFLVAAWTARYQFEGMVVGMELVSSMVSRFWEGMFPPVAKIKPRRGAFSWLQDRLSTELDSCKSDNRQMLTRGIQAASDLKDVVYEHFEDPPCNFRKIRDTLAGWLEQLPEPVAPTPDVEPAAPVTENAPVQQVQVPVVPTTAAPQTNPAGPGAGTAPAPVAAPPKRSNAPIEIPNLADDADAGKLLEHLARIANQLRGLAANSETPYLMLRKALWDAVGEPRSDHSGETFFPAPAEELMNAMTTMFKRAAWQELLERAEDLTNRWWYWLDLQYFAAEAASGLGWDAVADCIRDQTHALDQRLPRLKELKFNDSTPFANSTTRDWLARLVKRDSGSGGPASAEEPGEALLSQLRARGSEAFPEAMKLAQQTIETAIDRRTALALKVAAASFCLEVEQAEWAARLLETLILEIESQNLGWWEPRKVGEVWRLMYEAARKLAEDDDYYRPWVRRAMNGMASFDLNQVGRFPKKESR